MNKNKSDIKKDKKIRDTHSKISILNAEYQALDLDKQEIDSRIKDLNQQKIDFINKIHRDICKLDEQKSEKMKLLLEVTEQIKDCNTRLHGIRPKQKVSSHALIRYFERVKGFDMEDARNDILKNYIKYKAVIKDDIIVTLLLD